MAANHSLFNLLRHFQAEKSKGCKVKYEESELETERLQPKLPEVVKGDISFLKRKHKPT